MSYKVFVLYSHLHDRLFVGYTASLTDYMITMNVMESENPLYTFRPWTLIHMELFVSEEEALVREGFLKNEIGQDYIRREILPMFDFPS
ncbi:MAG: GIY-YIG nuclease family protein [Bacteroidetes bacterium]|nr:GIY-YIG nuclease family protein [Bacteroidota bacterium]